MENDPQFVNFKVEFINFFCRNHRFGAILRDGFNHILIGEKIDIFDENCENGDFVSVISPWKRHLQKKRSIPRRSQRKMQENCHLRFLIFKLLSQRFFDLKLAIFRFFENSKKRKFWRTWPPNYGRFLNTPIKVDRWKTLLVPCTSKLTLSIFFVGPFVLAQFWAIAPVISWSVKKLIFLMKIVKKGRFCFDHISMKTESLIKVWGSKTYLLDRPRRWVGIKAKTIISKGPILLYKVSHFSIFLKISKTVICHLRFWIFKILSQRFFNLKYGIFRFFEN